jgi:hypothetical protein
VVKFRTVPYHGVSVGALIRGGTTNWFATVGFGHLPHAAFGGLIRFGNSDLGYYVH